MKPPFFNYSHPALIFIRCFINVCIFTHFQPHFQRCPPVSLGLTYWFWSCDACGTRLVLTSSCIQNLLSIFCVIYSPLFCFKAWTDVILLHTLHCSTSYFPPLSLLVQQTKQMSTREPWLQKTSAHTSNDLLCLWLLSQLFIKLLGFSLIYSGIF